LHEKATRHVAGDFLRALLQAAPYKIHTVLTENVLTREGKAGEKRRFLSIPHGMCLMTTVPPSGFHEQGLSVRP
jgi:hypothetical protein